MKKVFISIIFLISIKISYSQEFVFPMYFEDAIGNRDTLFFGYDISATDSIDEIFGEQNIIDLPLNDALDVRVTDAYSYHSPTYHTKKQIINNSCNIPYTTLPVIKFDIKCSNWPITASWDSDLFTDVCNYYSDFASYPYYDALWDVVNLTDFSVSLRSQSSITFNKCDCESSSCYNSYIDNNDTLFLFYLGIDDEQIMVDIESNRLSKNKIEIHNHNDNLFIEIIDKDYVIDNAQIVDMNGKVIIKDHTNNVDISDLTYGIYLLRIQTNDKKVYSFKFIK